MTSVATSSPAVPGVVRPRVGGNRLGPGHPAFGRAPRYERAGEFPVDAERRDRNQRRRVQLAADEAARSGELSSTLYRALMAVLSFSDDRCSEPVWPSLETIARRVHGDDRYGPAAEERRLSGEWRRPPGQRTAARWLAELRALGWVQVRHRAPTRGDGGRLRWHSSLIRVDIPERWRVARHVVEDRARQAAGKGRPTPKAPQNTGARRGGRRLVDDGPKPSEVYRAAEQRRQAQDAATAAELPADQWREAMARARQALDDGPAPGRSP